jgi:hypothetical protein
MGQSITSVKMPKWMQLYKADIARAMEDETLSANQRRAFSSINQSMLPGEKQFMKEGTQVDLATLDDIIQNQGRRVSNLQAASDPGVMLKRETDFLDQLKRWRAEASKELPEDVNQAYNAAQQAYGEYSDKFRKGLVGSLLSHDREGNLRLADPTKLIKLFDSGSVGDVMQVAKLANTNPALKSELQKLAFAHYRSKVMEDGVTIDLKKHMAYMKPFGEGGFRELTRGFFNDREWNLIQSAGGHAKVFLDKEKALKEAGEKWTKLFGGKFAGVDDLSPQRLITMAFNTEGAHKAIGPKEMGYAMDILRKYDPDAIPAYQDAIRQSLIDKVKPNQYGPLDLNALKKIVDRNGATGKNLGVILGNDYVDKLHGVIGFLNRSDITRILPGPISSGQASIFENLRKGILGPLSHESTIAGLAGGYRKSATQAAIYEALVNPDALKSMEGFYKRLGIGVGAAGSVALLLKPEDEAND